MVLYLIIINVCVFIIATVTYFCSNLSYFGALGYTYLATLIVMILDGIVAGIARSLPKRFANDDLKIYKVSAKEKNFYEKIKIRRWKDKIPEIGHMTGFRKNKIEDPNNIEYIDRFLLEICYGEIGHTLSVFTSYLLLLFFFIHETFIFIALPVAFVSSVLNILPILVLRYNFYKLKIVKTVLLKKQALKEKNI